MVVKSLYFLGILFGYNFLMRGFGYYVEFWFSGNISIINLRVGGRIRRVDRSKIFKNSIWYVEIVLKIWVIIIIVLLKIYLLCFVIVFFF